ncbi:hypothetical protein [Sorangium cellulosum]|uniref:Secreted protein n=1 Tax=Sorangium cellulosum TaxID=56 RepID=A0A150Q5H6_SORCE|nr:hypothetical protein [Sorangium cellulosum]KYF63255.1 hypothetical protein BE15_02830 [Sorangium cellulosum]
MKRTIRGPSFRAAAFRLGVASLIAAALASGCGGSPPPAASAKATARPAPAARDGQGARTAAVEQRAQREAQRAWCVYLEELYERASEQANGWPKFEECTQRTTMASPRMLRATSECSLAALRRFEGDPFTPAYAEEVSRCGAEAMTATSLPRSDLAPYMAVLCGRLAGCGDLDYATCRQSLEDGLGPQLERAIGAMNSRGRQEVRACFGKLACGGDLGPQISACLEPIMDDLLWLPG